MSSVAQTIWNQISIHTKMACGARKATASDTALTFQVGGEPMHFIRVVLEPSDTYRVEHFRVKRGSYEQVTLESAVDIYAENLSEVVYHMVNK